MAVHATTIWPQLVEGQVLSTTPVGPEEGPSFRDDGCRRHAWPSSLADQ